MDPLKMNHSVTNIKHLFSTQDVEIVDVKMDNLLNNHNFSIPEYCIEKFIKTEMDHQSPGLRGVGRVTDETPRFGGYYRSNVNNLYKDEIVELEMLFREIIYNGYFIHAILYEEVLKPAKFEDKYKLYQMWIMYILGFDNNSIFQIMEKLGKASQTAIVTLKEKLGEFGFPMTDTEADVLDRIIRFYGIAGYTLRRREMGIKL